MKIRCDLHVNGGARKLILVPGPAETVEHLALKLAAFLLFWDEDPFAEVGPKHPAVADQEFLPDVLATAHDGAVKVWVECGKVTLHKLGKLTRRLGSSRIVVLKESEREAKRLRGEIAERLDRGGKVEILAWPEGSFQEWLGTLREQTEVYGEAGGRTLNVVINEHPFAADLLAF